MTGARLPRLDDTTIDLVLQLIAGLYRAPGSALATDLAEGGIASAVSAVADDLDIAAPSFAHGDLATLQASHVALFVSSAAGLPAPPYVGLAAGGGEVLGPRSEARARFYAEQGIEPAASWRDLPDHVAAVAEAGLLLLGSGRRAAAEVLLSRFIAPWFERYAAAVEAADVSGFYGPLTRFLRSAVLEVSREATP
jgi:putative dimethyl sulfoxide reductase chaperone